jgi:hypothetical protein
METVLAGLQWDICLIYLDDVIVLGSSFEDMVTNLRKVYDRLLTAGLKLKAKKCHLFCKKVVYLGHIISEAGIATDPEKTKIVESWTVPTNVKELRSFMGFCGYYRKFIQNFSKLAKCLHKLTEKGQKFEWTNECQTAFEELKNRLVFPFTCLSTSSAKTSGSLRGGYFSGCADPVAILCFTTFVLP